jgi:group I intron endonuclease
MADHPILPARAALKWPLPRDVSALSAIYRIRHVATGRGYVGSAVVLARRRNYHFLRLTGRRHPNRLLQRAWDKYGEDAFVFDVLEVVENKTGLIAREQFWIDALRAADEGFGFNLWACATSALGKKHSPGSIAKMKANRAPTRHSPEMIAHLRAVKLGKKASAETKARMSAVRKGLPHAPEHAAKLRASMVARNIARGERIRAEKATAEHRS